MCRDPAKSLLLPDRENLVADKEPVRDGFVFSFPSALTGECRVSLSGERRGDDGGSRSFCRRPRVGCFADGHDPEINWGEEKLWDKKARLLSMVSWSQAENRAR